MAKQSMKSNDRKWIVVSVICAVLILGMAFLFPRHQERLISKSEFIIDLLYKFDGSNVDALDKNAEVLEKLCDKDVFSILDTRLPYIKQRRLMSATTTIPDIQYASCRGNEVMLIVAFNKECRLQDKVIQLTYSTSGKLEKYREFVLRDKFNIDNSFSVLEEFDGSEGETEGETTEAETTPNASKSTTSN